MSYSTGEGQENLAPVVLLELEVGMKFQTTCRGDLAKTKWVCGSACFPYGNLYKKTRGSLIIVVASVFDGRVSISYMASVRV